MVYGHFYYPLYALGTQHLGGAVEAALEHRCNEAKCTDVLRGIHAKTKWLRSRDLISQEQDDRLQRLRELRNSTAHPSFQMVIFPWNATGMLRDVAEELGRLFPIPESP
jgi:hypothetical protein